MSMIIICQSDIDLTRYGLKNAYSVGMTKINEIAKTLDFKGELWSNDVFCCLYDESCNYLNSFDKNKSFSETPIFYFLNEILEKCDKIAVFYCEPSTDISTWTSCDSKEMFLIEMEKVLRTDGIIRTIIFVNTKKYVMQQHES